MPCNTCQSKPDLAMKDYFSSNLFTWCTNCGNFGINAAIKRSLVALNIAPCQTVLCFDIGCNGNGADKIGGYTFHGLHGRVIPAAAGISLANTKLNVIAFGGDGGTLGEGVGHLVHAIRANYNVTFILHNNLNYGLTKGQASSTTKKEMKMDSSPDGTTSGLLHPLEFVFSLPTTFVARTFSGDVKHMDSVFQRAIQHQGFSFVEVLQSCPTYNKQTPHEWYQERVYDVSTRPDYDTSNKELARQVARDIDEHIALGVMYQEQGSIPQEKLQVNRKDIQTELVDETREYDISALLESFR